MGILASLISYYQYSNFSKDKIIKATHIITPISLIISIAYCVQYNYTGRFIFENFSDKIAYFLSLSDYGAKFMFGNIVNSDYFFTDGSTWPGFGFQFGFKVLPTIIFFGGMMSVLYYLGIMQKVINSLSKFMRWTIGTSGG